MLETLSGFPRSSFWFCGAWMSTFVDYVVDMIATWYADFNPSFRTITVFESRKGAGSSLVTHRGKSISCMVCSSLVPWHGYSPLLKTTDTDLLARILTKLPRKRLVPDGHTTIKVDKRHMYYFTESFSSIANAEKVCNWGFERILWQTKITYSRTSKSTLNHAKTCSA